MMQPFYYILSENGEILQVDYEKWSEWIRTADRTVARTMCKDCEVSTVFLPGDHHLYPNDPPFLFETMIFGGLFDELVRRYHTLEEAMRGHERMVALAKIRPGVQVALRSEPNHPLGVVKKIRVKTGTIEVTSAGALEVYAFEELTPYEAFSE